MTNEINKRAEGFAKAAMRKFKNNANNAKVFLKNLADASNANGARQLASDYVAAANSL